MVAQVVLKPVGAVQAHQAQAQVLAGGQVLPHAVQEIAGVVGVEQRLLPLLNEVDEGLLGVAVVGGQGGHLVLPGSEGLVGLGLLRMDDLQHPGLLPFHAGLKLPAHLLVAVEGEGIFPVVGVGLDTGEKVHGVPVVTVGVGDDQVADLEKVEAVLQPVEIGVGGEIDEQALVHQGLGTGAHAPAAFGAGFLAHRAGAEGGGNALGRSRAQIGDLHGKTSWSYQGKGL